MAHTTTIQDGSWDFSGGVNGNVVTTLQSTINPDGCPRNVLPWLVNGTVRGGGILPRTGYIPNGPNGGLLDNTGNIFQGWFLYVPINDSPPYLVASVGGHILKYEIDTGIVTDLSTNNQTSTVPTAGPWTITLLNTNDNYSVGLGLFLNMVGVGDTFQDSNYYYTGSIGSFSQFVVPPVGQTVVVTLGAAYTGAVGDLIRLVPAVTVAGSPPTTYDDVFEVVAFDPAFQSNTQTLLNPPTVPKAFFCQGEQFLVIQAGDGVTLPLFWDGSTLRRSNGLNPPYPMTPELPAATSMTYYMGRIWYAQNRLVSAGDIVKGPSGTAAYKLTDSILKVTENPLAIGGDGFTVPSNAGTIQALDFEVNLDAELAQGRLLAFTRKTIYALAVPVTRAEWIATNQNNAPNFVVANIGGTSSDRSIVSVNSDKFFQSLEPSIRSYATARQYFGQWGNKSVSSNEDRILKYNNRGLMQFATGIEFENRMYQGVLPMQTLVGVVHQAIISLDYEPISSLQSTIEDNVLPVWEGHSEGINVLQLCSGDFGGRPRAFAAIVSKVDGSIDVWELTDYSTRDDADNRITVSPEFPSFTWGKEFELKELQAMEVWVDSVFGEVEMDIYYRPDADPCWHLWAHTKFCAARNCEESMGVNSPCVYPVAYEDGYKFPILFGIPKAVCSKLMQRPSNLGYQFQPKIVVKGWCRIRGIMLHAEPKDKPLFEGMVCR